MSWDEANFVISLAREGIRTVPVPNWEKETLDAWITAAGIKSGRYFDVSVGQLNHGETAFQKRRPRTP
jgi:hypothetical protein